MGKLDLFHKPVRMANLASGSSGNATIVAAPTDSVLVDCGISCRQVIERSRALGLDPARIRAIVLTHEHSDHVAGARVTARRLDVPVYATAGCRAALRFAIDFELREITPGVPFRVGELELEPFRIPHDTADPVAFTVGLGEERVGIATDMGSVSRLVVERLRACRAVLLEFNHDVDLLMNGSYPWALKQRIRGRLGHLSNEQGAEILTALHGGGSRVQEVLLAHLSAENNTPRLARDAAEAACRTARTDGDGIRVALAEQDRPSPIYAVGGGAVERLERV